MFQHKKNRIQLKDRSERYCQESYTFGGVALPMPGGGALLTLGIGLLREGG